MSGPKPIVWLNYEQGQWTPLTTCNETLNQMAALGILTCEILELEFAYLLGEDAEITSDMVATFSRKKSTFGRF